MEDNWMIHTLAKYWLFLAQFGTVVKDYNTQTCPIWCSLYIYIYIHDWKQFSEKKLNYFQWKVDYDKMWSHKNFYRVAKEEIYTQGFLKVFLRKILAVMKK